MTNDKRNFDDHLERAVRHASNGEHHEASVQLSIALGLAKRDRPEADDVVQECWQQRRELAAELKQFVDARRPSGRASVESCERCGTEWRIGGAPETWTVERCWLCHDRFVAHPPDGEGWAAPEISSVQYLG